MTRPHEQALLFRRGSSTARFVLVQIAMHANNDTGEAWPSVETIAAATGDSERTVRRAIAELEDLGAVIVHRTKGRGGNRYTLPWVGPTAENAATKTALFPDNEVTTSAFPAEPGHRDRLPDHNPVTVTAFPTTTPSPNPVTTSAFPDEPGHRDRLPDHNAVTVTAELEAATAAAAASDPATAALELIATTEADAAVARGAVAPAKRGGYRASILRRLRSENLTTAQALATSGLDAPAIARAVQPEAFADPQAPRTTRPPCGTCHDTGTVDTADGAVWRCPDCAPADDPARLPDHLRPTIERQEALAS